MASGKERSRVGHKNKNQVVVAKKTLRGTSEREPKQLSPDLSGHPRHGMFGYVERIDRQGIAGWLVDAADPGKNQTVRVLLDGVQILDGKTQFIRSDTSELLGAVVYCGFELRWRDISPEGALEEAEDRLGTLEVLTTEGDTLPLCDSRPGAEELYAWVETYLRRLSLVLGVSTVSAPRNASEMELLKEAFDEEFYRALYPEVAQAGTDLLEHFCEAGWKEGMDPTPDFSVSHYLSDNPDVRAAGINPFLHFLQAGRDEGRQGRMPGGFRTEALRHLKPLDAVVKSWRRPDALKALSRRTLLQKITDQIGRRDPTGIVLSVSHDDYTRNVGGIQLCLALEQKAFNDAGALYLHLSPWQPLPVLAGNRTERIALRVICDGEELGSVLGNELVGVVGSLREEYGKLPAWLAVHSMHGHAPELIADLHQALRPEDAYFWLHDYFTLCPGYNLLRNQVSYCGAPREGSAACAICVYGENRPQHGERVSRLFETVPLRAVAPSRYAAAAWSAATQLPVRELIVKPHCRFVQESQRLFLLDNAEEDAATDEANAHPPVRVAFLGHPAVHKGWPVFLELVRQCCGLERYEFWHLGTRGDTQLPIQFREVTVSPDEPDAMIRAIEDASIDVVVQWSIWPETFGISARESVAAGALLVTSAVSGGVAEYVAAEGLGVVLDDESALFRYFRGQEVVDAVASRRRSGVPVGPLAWGGLTADLTFSPQTTSAT